MASPVMETRILPGTRALAVAAADEIRRAAELAVSRRERFTVALSGGSTPQPLLELLASPDWAEQIPWDVTQVLWADERCVPPDHPDSNYGMAHRLLLSRAGVPAQQIHRMRGEDEPLAAAAAYEQELLTTLGPGARLDLALLGMGADGHTASLFPHAAALAERHRLVVADEAPGVEHPRLTLTYPALNRCRRVVFLVAGPEKAEAVAAVLGAVRHADSGRKRLEELVSILPAAGVLPEAGTVLWLLDEPAAAALAPEERQ